MTKIQISELSSVEGPNLKEISLKDWLAEGERLFGADKKLWKWKCSNCGHVQSISDFIELRNKKILPADFDVGTVVYFSCIGRFDTRIPEKDIGTVWNKKSPCNYTLGGLFVFANTFVIGEDGQRHPAFDFAKGMCE
uniref:Uncharacterized protein n=1 Tax=viral metagenome TaxID=1070528 RepID=A0A6M3LLZ3_9ZZZZ